MCEGYSAFSTPSPQSSSAQPLANSLEGSHRGIQPSDSTQFFRTLQTMAELPELDYQSFDFCRRQTIYDIATYYLTRFWTQTVLAACHENSTILHAMLALSGAHRLYHDARNGLPPSQQAEVAVFSHYGKSLNLLHKRMAASSLVASQEVLIACLILLTFDVFQGRYREALVHLDHGRQILKTLQSCTMEGKETISLCLPAKAESTLDEISYSFALMDLQSVSFGSQALHFRLIDDSTEAGTTVRKYEKSFSNLDEAWRSMLLLLNEAHYFKLTIAEGQNFESGEKNSSLHIWQGRFLGNLRQWKQAFDTGPLRTDTFRKHPGPAWWEQSTLLQLSHAYLVAIVQVILHRDDELVYDTLLPEYSKITLLCEGLAGRLPPLKLDAVIVPALYYVGCRCRHPDIRRRVLQLLPQIGREGHWDAKQIEILVREKMKVEEEMAQYVHRPTHSLPEDGALLAKLIPRHARWTELWVDFQDEDYRKLRLRFKRRLEFSGGMMQTEVHQKLVKLEDA